MLPGMSRPSLFLLALLCLRCGSSAATDASAKPGGSGSATPEARSALASARPVASSTGAAGTASASSAPSSNPGADGTPGDMIAVEGGLVEANDLNDNVFKLTAEPFAIDVREVTVAQYRECVAAGGCSKLDDVALQPGRCNFQHTDREDHPINCVPKSMATAYCTFMKKRLPTAAEWQLAAAGKEDRKYPWGDAEPTSEMACWKHPDGTCPVGKTPSGNTPSGIQDMAGNVAEILLDDGCIGKAPAGTACLQPVVYTHGGAWNELDRASVLSKNVSQVVVPETAGFRCARSSSDKAPQLLPP
jgi:formylglycine-generating enzyme required for sulfatase activity